MSRRRVLATLGDVNFLDYGGAVLYQDDQDRKRGEASLDIIDVVCKDTGNSLDCCDCRECRDGNWQRQRNLRIWTAIVPLTGSLLTEYDWISEEDIAAMSGFCGHPWEPENPDPYFRAAAVIEIADYFGKDNLDEYPITLGKTALLRARPFYRGAIKVAKRPA